MNGPLSGIRIIEVGHMLMAPYCGMLLADLGADVIKIEPVDGDIGRRVSPYYVGEHNTYFASLNRNKRSVVLDLKSEYGQEQLGELVSGAQALITNLRPSAIKSLGLTYSNLKLHNERIVCVALTGFGLDSPYQDLPAYDYVIQALTGVMNLTGDPGGAPTKTGYSAVDNASGIMGAVGLLAKIIEGKGGQVDIAMYDVMLSQLNYLASGWLNSGEILARFPNSAHPYIVPAQNFQASDGWLVIFITHDNFWKIFCQKTGKAEWLSDPRFATMSARRMNRDHVVAEIAQLFASQPTAYWLELLCSSGIVISRIESLEMALVSEQSQARKMVVAVQCEAGPIKMVGNPIKTDSVATHYAPPPELGQHNRELLETIRQDDD